MAGTTEVVPLSSSEVAPLSSEELRKMHAYWRACNYLSAGMIYLRANPLLREPLKPEHIKNRLLGHWGSDPGQSLIWVHLNRLIRKYDLNVMYISGPGHGAPATLANCYLEGHYSEIYPDKSRDEPGLLKFFQQFSFPGGIGSHCTPETPGSIHEGGELGYSISHAYGAAFDNPDLIVAVAVGDGEAETGPLATSWHSNKFLNPIRDGAVLPVLHLNGYKIANPTVLARISHEELVALLIGYGHKPYFVEGDDPLVMHQKMASTLEQCILEIRSIQQNARSTKNASRPRWPMIVLRSPKGWTGPKEVDGHKVEGSWRAHQVPITDPVTNKQHLKLLEDWLRSYKTEELFNANGTLMPELQELAPAGPRRISANPHANGGLLRKELDLPDFRDYAVEVKAWRDVCPANGRARTFSRRSDAPQHEFLPRLRAGRDRFQPADSHLCRFQENLACRIHAGRCRRRRTRRRRTRHGNAQRAHARRLVRRLRSHWPSRLFLHATKLSYTSSTPCSTSTPNGWRNQRRNSPGARQCRHINLLITSLVWRQDHNGFTHQDPGFLDVVTNKSPDVVRIYLPPDANCLLSVTDHCLRSRDYVNVIVADKQEHLQYLTMPDAVIHCTKGIGIWDWASTDDGQDPDVVMACAGDIATMESLAAVAILKEHFQDLKIRFVNIVDLFRLMPATEHPHGLSDRDFDSLFTTNKPVIFNFHSYSSLIHKLSYRRANHDNIHVRGYKEKGNINTPLELAILNQIDRFDLAIDVIDRVPRLRSIGAHVKEWLKGQIIESISYAHAEGIDKEEIRNWKWPA